MSKIYEGIGRLVVALFWRRFGRQIKVAGAVALAAVVVGGFVAAARKDVEEG